MRYIASGFYYHVYRLSESRVQKVPTSRLRKAWLLAVWRMTTSPWDWWTEVRNIDPWFMKELALTRALVSEFPTPKLLGNPSPIEHDGSYSQDYARSLGHMLREWQNASRAGAYQNEPSNTYTHKQETVLAQFEQYVREYCTIQHELWRHGFGERIWNFTFNCGIEPVNGRLILIDLNELTRDKETMRTHIQDKHWRTQNSLAWLAKRYPALAAVAERVLDKECTEARLEELWGEARYEGTRESMVH